MLLTWQINCKVTFSVIRIFWNEVLGCLECFVVSKIHISFISCIILMSLRLKKLCLGCLKCHCVAKSAQCCISNYPSQESETNCLEKKKGSEQVSASFWMENKEHMDLCVWLRNRVCMAVWATHSELGHVLWSVENWIGVDVCTREQKTAGEEMLMTFMGNKLDIYLQLDRCTWPLGWFSYTQESERMSGETWRQKVFWRASEAETRKHKFLSKQSDPGLFFSFRNRNVSASP